jgi:hypothetical protein
MGIFDEAMGTDLTHLSRLPVTPSKRNNKTVGFLGSLNCLLAFPCVTGLKLSYCNHYKLLYLPLDNQDSNYLLQCVILLIMMHCTIAK